MKHDPFEFNGTDMTWCDKAWRVGLLIVLISVLIGNVFFWGATP